MWQGILNTMANWRAGASQPSRSTGTIFISSLRRCHSKYTQLARNFAMPKQSPLYIYHHRNVLRNSKYTSAKFHVHRVSCMRKYIDLTRHLYSWHVCALLVVGLRCSQLCMLLACIYLYCTQVFAQLLHHFWPYISWIAPARQQCSTFC